jgi:DNA-binding transcriptional LysR family regulator
MNLLSSLRYLVALNEHKHFGRAAKACHITQPALSNALRSLEAEFNVMIVRRDRNYVGLTEEGAKVLESAHRMLQEHASLQQVLQSDSVSPSGSLRIGCVPTALPVVARFATLLQSQHPRIKVSIFSMSSKELERGLEDLSLDLAMGYQERMKASSRLSSVAQYKEKYYLLRRCEKDQKVPLYIGKPISWKEAAKYPLCLLTPDMHNRAIVDAAFESADAAVQPAMQTNSMFTLVLSVTTGSICSVLPGAFVAALRDTQGLEALPLIEPEVQTPMGFLTHATTKPSRALEAALKLAQESAWLSSI